MKEQKHLRGVQDCLAPFRGRRIAHFINGRHEQGNPDHSFDNVAPADNSLIGPVARGGAKEINAAAQAAARAFDDWRLVPGKEKKALLHKIADVLVERREELAQVESMDTGQPIRFMSKAALRAAENFRFFADRAPAARDGLSLPTEQHLNYTMRVPLGPIGVITPWNTPLMLSTWKIAPALAAGCTVVHKPAEWSPLTATMLAECCSEAGLPDGVLNVVHGMGEEAGKLLTEHELIRGISFVGESCTGSCIAQQGAPTLKRMHFELGGKNPVLVFDDADMERALDAVVFMIYSLNGERCTSSSRLLVQRSIHDDFIEALTARVKRLKVGHPLDPSTEIGPLIHREHLEKVMEYFSIAVQEGARIAAGGRRSDFNEQGNYVTPTLFSNAKNQMRIAQEEIFGPVLTAIPFNDEQEALALANECRYGLAAYLWTGETGRAHRLAQRMEAGMIWVNSENNRHLPAPFGGMKASGIGRDGGDYSFDFYMETKNICVALGEHQIPRLGT